MNLRGRISPVLVIVVLVVVLLIAAGVLLFMRRSPETSTTNSSGNNTTAPEQIDVAKVEWPKYTSPYQVTVALPRGMFQCDNGQGVFSVRNNECSSKDAPTFRYRRIESLDAMDPVAAFNDVFAQELREFGIESVAGRGTTFTSETVTVLMMTLSDTLTAAIVTEREPLLNTSPRKVAVEVRRDIPPTVDGLAQEVDVTMRTVLAAVRFSVPRTITNTNVQ